MKLSIFTPTHDSRFLPQVYASIKDQPFDEWVILHNNGGVPMKFGDKRVKQHVAYDAPPFVGCLKALAVERCTGDALMELDHDDLLMPGAVQAAKEALSRPGKVFAYSNTIRATGDLAKTERFSEEHGWRYRGAELAGRELDECVAFAPTPSALSKIWYAPDHFRAFRRDVYELAGGHNREMRILDDQDLMARLYLQGEFEHVDRALYVYRIHGANSWMKYNAEIQENVLRLHDRYIQPMAIAWAKRRGLRVLDLGGSIDPQKGFETVDKSGGDVECDLEGRWPFDDSSVGVVRAYDVFEHLRDPLATMRELYRVLAPGGMAFIQVPSTDGRGAFQDPTHVSFWNENSFHYYTRADRARYVGTPVRFQAARLFTTEKNAEQVCWTVANLVSLKDGHRPPGLVTI